MSRILHACHSADHWLGRRQFFGHLARTGAGAALAGLGSFATPAMAENLTRQQKRLLVIRMAGGVSQLETRDPKPRTKTGGPFRAIPTSVPGVHLSELLPQTARQMHRLALIRSINTHEDDHGKGHHLMVTGRVQTPGQAWPELGAVVAKALDTPDRTLPGHIVITPGGGGGRNADSAYLGPKYPSLVVVLSECGRTPHINHLYGRDHWSKAWSIALAGARIHPGAVIGKTNDLGTEVTEREVDGGDLFHTYLAALGVKSSGNFTIAGQKLPLADPAFEPIHELLA